MVTTGEGKFYSTGVDVVTVQSPNPGQFLEVLTQLQRLLARLLTFPMVTVAAINGEEVVGAQTVCYSTWRGGGAHACKMGQKANNYCLRPCYMVMMLQSLMPSSLDKQLVHS